MRGLLQAAGPSECARPLEPSGPDDPACVHLTAAEESLDKLTAALPAASPDMAWDEEGGLRRLPPPG
jgi:hypothetical protein